MEKQKSWGWLALGNFFLGGAGAGTFVVASLLSLFQGRSGAPTAFEVIASSALVVLGLGLVFLELGKKSRPLNVILNLRTSWMSREAGAASLFVVSALASLVFPSVYLTLLALLSAVVLIASHGFVLMAAKAIPSWSTPASPPVMWASSLASGSALVALVAQPAAPNFGGITTTVGLTSAALLGFTAVYFAAASRNERLKEALGEEGNATVFLVLTLVGGLLPLALSASGAITARMVIAPLLLLVGSFSAKYVLVLRLSYRLPLMALGRDGYIFPASR